MLRISMDLVAGTMVTPNVRLLRLLGEGGMGSVWVADHLSLNTQVAVKFIAQAIVDADPAVRERFNREASLSAKIKSPHVVQTFDHGLMDGGIPYIVMELLEGESLGDRLERIDALSFAETEAVVAQTAKALSKAHRLGIVHRDIKPDNLFLTDDGDEGDVYIKVLDFGIAKQTGSAEVQSVTSTGAMVGTPEYMSPEQALSAKSVDQRADLWALAVVAYHCLTGTVPFSGETLGSLCVAIANGGFVAPSELREELLGSVDTWFDRALATDKNRRFADARQLARSFAAALHGEVASEISSPEASSPETSSPETSDPDNRGAIANATDAGAAEGDTSARVVGSNGSAAIGSAATIATPSRTFGGASVAHEAPSPKRSVLIGAAAITLGLGGGLAAVLWTNSDAATRAHETSAHETRASNDRAPAASTPPSADATVNASAGDAASATAKTPAAPVTANAPVEALASASAAASASASASPAPNPTHFRRPPSGPKAPPPSLPKDRGF